MNRRTALFLTLLLGGLVPRSLRAQSPVWRGSTKGGRLALQPARSRRSRDDEPVSGTEPEHEPTVEHEPGVTSIPSEPGHELRRFDLSRYTSLAHTQANPQNALIEWIFRRTGSAPWHGDKIAVLCASQTLLRAYHNPKVLKQVEEVVERFVQATNDVLSIRVRFVAAVDTRWRYAVYSRLTPVGSGPQGQQIWTLKVEDSAFVLAQMQVYQGFKLLTDQKVEMINGQTLTIRTSEMRGFTGGLQRESAAGLGYQPKADQLEEGVTLRISPLADLRRRCDRRRDRADGQHGQELPSDPDHRPARDRPERDDDRRARGHRVAAQPDGQGLAAGPDPADLGRHPARHPPVQDRLPEPPDPRHRPDRDRAAGLPRRRDRQQPPATLRED